MAGVVLVLVAFGILASVVLFVVAYRRRPVAPVPPRDTPSRSAVATLDRLEVGAEVQYDDREWVVVGVQRFAARDDFAAWTAWHLDQRGQPGWLATVDGDEEHVIFAVAAEHPEAIDPTDDPLIWRDVRWVRVAETAPGPQPVEAEGERRRRRQPREPLTDHDAERVTFTREDLPARRLILERRTHDERWAAWIGDRVAVTLLHVTRWPPS